MNATRLLLSFEGERRQFAPGDTLTGKYVLEGLDPAELRAVELSILWYTEGKGEEDLAVHHFERLEANGAAAMDFRQPQRFSTRLPLGPLSYAGVIVKVCWCARLRVFVAQGKELLAEIPFRLGRVPAAQEVQP